MNDNKRKGNRFEQELSHMLADNRFWVHVFQQNKSGQPADLIAVKGNYHTLIDCKLKLSKGGFPLTRIEENQRYAMTRFSDRSGYTCWFAVKMPEGDIRFANSSMIFYCINRGMKTLSLDILRNCMDYDTWLKRMEEICLI